MVIFPALPGVGSDRWLDLGNAVILGDKPRSDLAALRPKQVFVDLLSLRLVGRSI